MKSSFLTVLSLVAVFGVLIGKLASEKLTVDYVTATITDKTLNDKSSYVFTDGETFDNHFALFGGKNDKTELYKKLEIGKTYKLKVCGIKDCPRLIGHRNILDAELVEEFEE